MNRKRRTSNQKYLENVHAEDLHGHCVTFSMRISYHGIETWDLVANLENRAGKLVRSFDLKINAVIA